MTPEPNPGLPTHTVPSGLDPTDWSVAMTGAVRQSTEFSIPELRDFEWRTCRGDFSCIEGWTVPDIDWRGIPIGTLLDEVRPTSEASYGLVGGIDEGYACGFTLSRLRSGLLALEVDGGRLPVDYGGPARLVLPNDESECYERVKWVTWIEIRAQLPEELDTAKGIALSRIE